MPCEVEVELDLENALAARTAPTAPRRPMPVPPGPDLALRADLPGFDSARVFARSAAIFSSAARANWVRPATPSSGPGIDRLPSPSSPSALASSLALLRVRSPSHFSLRSASRPTPRERAAAWMIVDASSTTAAAGGAAAGAGRDGCGRSRSSLARRPYARLAVDDRPPVWPTDSSDGMPDDQRAPRGKRGGAQLGRVNDTNNL